MYIIELACTSYISQRLLNAMYVATQFPVLELLGINANPDMLNSEELGLKYVHCYMCTQHS